MEAHGQSGQTVPTATHEPEEFAAFHPRHPAGHVPTSSCDLLEARERDGAAERQRVFPRVHLELEPKVQTDHQTVQGGQGEDV